MAKTKKYLTTAAILIAFAIVLVFVGKYTGFLGSIVGTGDGYFIYGQSDVDLTNKSGMTSAFYTWTGTHQSLSGGGGTSTAWSVSGTDVDLIVSDSCSQYGCIGDSPVVRTTGDFAGRDVKVDVQVQYNPQTSVSPYSGSTSLQIQTSNGINLATESFSGGAPISFQGGLELKRQVFSNTTQVYWKGQFVTTYNNSANEKLVLSASAGQGSITAHFKNIRYLPTFSCQLGSTDLLGMESFSGSITSAITLQPSACNNSTNVRCLRYPVKSFCLANPAILTDSTKGGAASTAEPYQILIGGNQVPLTGTQTLTLFYVIDNSQGIIPTQCSIQKAYNINNGTCTDLTGVVQICSQGILDSTTGLCVVQPSVSCSNGTYNNQTNTCQVIPPSGVSCSTYGSGYVYNNATGVCERNATPVTACTNGRLDLQTNTCIYNPPVSTVCSQGTYNNATNQCELHIDTSCPQGFNYDAATQSCKSSTTYAQQAAAASQPAASAAPVLGTKTTTVTYTSVAWWYATPTVAFVVLLIILAVLYLLFFTGMNGKRRWEKFKAWAWINKEGMLVGAILVSLAFFFEYYLGYIIPIIGPILELLRQSYPVWVVVFVVGLLFVIVGAIIDMLYKPKQ